MTKRKKILIVDDDQYNVEIVSVILSYGYDIYKEYSESETIHFIKTTIVDLIILD